MKNKPFKVLWSVLKNTKADKILYFFIVFILLDAAVIWLTEPTIVTYGQALWYCYAVISTAGFGDMVVTTLIPRICSVLLTIYSSLVLAIITGVVVNFYTQTMELKNKETLASFLDRMEHLPELSNEELAELSGRVKEFRKKWR